VAQGVGPEFKPQYCKKKKDFARIDVRTWPELTKWKALTCSTKM
jgi:hypothetical protein